LSLADHHDYSSTACAAGCGGSAVQRGPAAPCASTWKTAVTAGASGNVIRTTASPGATKMNYTHI
jgi:hypothetical protein